MGRLTILVREVRRSTTLLNSRAYRADRLARTFLPPSSGKLGFMSITNLRTPRVYRRGRWARISEGLRYGGGIGQWAWLIHRVTGIGILIFLIIHIVDTFFVVAYPELYDHTVAIYGGNLTALPVTWGMNGYYWPLRWAFRIGELGLIACVLFHALNGIRVVLFDFWPRAALHQRVLFNWVLGIFAAIMIPLTIWVVLPLRHSPEGYRPPVSSAHP